AVEYLMFLDSGIPMSVSRLFIFYTARVMEEKTQHIGNSGVTIESGIKALQKFGVCKQSTWPYDSRSVNRIPSQKAFEEAQRITIEPIQVQMDLNTMRECLAMGYPFSFGLKLFFYEIGRVKRGLHPYAASDREDFEQEGISCRVGGRIR
ncbi:unnamed protein product, partial [Didymodactylos carnosus]